MAQHSDGSRGTSKVVVTVACSFVAACELANVRRDSQSDGNAGMAGQPQDGDGKRRSLAMTLERGSGPRRRSRSRTPA
jgi:hypothetical protein